MTARPRLLGSMWRSQSVTALLANTCTQSKQESEVYDEYIKRFLFVLNALFGKKIRQQRKQTNGTIEIMTQLVSFRCLWNTEYWKYQTITLILWKIIHFWRDSCSLIKFGWVLSWEAVSKVGDPPRGWRLGHAYLGRCGDLRAWQRCSQTRVLKANKSQKCMMNILNVFCLFWMLCLKKKTPKTTKTNERNNRDYDSTVNQSMLGPCSHHERHATLVLRTFSLKETICLWSEWYKFH